jgi:serine/threonine protein phosphatase 1
MAAERLTFAVGDIHGRSDLLKAGLRAMAQYTRGRSAKFIFLGDYVDRGADSAGVIKILLALQEQTRVVCLKGNHEDLMLRALQNGTRESADRWLTAGGDATLQSYGTSDWESAGDAIPKAHLHWMQTLPLTSGDDHRIYVHAGLMPSVPMAEQTPEACMWIRDRFLKAEASQFETHVVHGHTPIWAQKQDPALPELLNHRTNLDSGAYMTNVLTAGIFDTDRPGGPIDIIQIRGEPGTVPVARICPVDEFAPTPLSQAASKSSKRWYWPF